MILLQYGLNSKDVHDLLNVAKGIWKETQFDNRAEGFVILLNSRKVSYFGFGPIEESLVYVADHFYLAPLLPLYPFNKDIKIEQIKAEWSECLKSVLPAAVEGKVQTLFLAKGIDIYGLYDRHNEILLIDEKKTINNISLFNLIAVNTHLHGGQVYFLDQEEMPAKFSKIKAVFRS